MKTDGKELDELIENRKAARQLALNQAMAGDEICGAMFALETIAQDAGLGFVARTQQDYSDDDDDDIRPF